MVFIFYFFLKFSLWFVSIFYLIYDWVLKLFLYYNLGLKDERGFRYGFRGFKGFWMCVTKNFELYLQMLCSCVMGLKFFLFEPCSKRCIFLGLK